MDVAFREDGIRVRSGQGTMTLNLFRNFALNLIKAEKRTVLSPAYRRRAVSWNTVCPAKVFENREATALMLGPPGRASALSGFRQP